MKGEAWMELTQEQKDIIKTAMTGKNLLIDACIGSGKTTILQLLCNGFTGKRVLYLTYNKLLKLEAKKKIVGTGKMVTNYHGFAYMLLQRAGIKSGQSDLIRTLIKNKPKVLIPNYDVILIDEYQDIDQEISEMLTMIKKKNPTAQLIAVGDMAQKIYDFTTLNVKPFMKKFLGDYELMSLTTCFRLSAAHAKTLSSVWNKQINGVNPEYIIKTISLQQAIKIAAATEPHDILCLGARTGQMVRFLNELEANHPDIYNKRTVYASIRDSEGGASLSPADDVAIFTTFDASKGLEKEVCLLFDYTLDYYETRASKNGVKYEILRNIFCVAASRAKKAVYFIKNAKDQQLTFKHLATPFETKQGRETYNISEMFDFKYKESVDACMKWLECNPIPVNDSSIIPIIDADYNIDLMPCVGIFQEILYFKQFNYERAVNQYRNTSDSQWSIVDEILKLPEPKDITGKTLYITAAMTLHMRYVNQVVEEFITDDGIKALYNRLSEELRQDEAVQIKCDINRANLKAKGLCDVLIGDVAYELKFVQELTNEHYLQLASYMYALEAERGILWNTRTNEKIEVRIKNKEAFINSVEKAVNKW